MDIGKRIRAERKAQGLSQDVLARRADVNLAVINRLERGASTDPHITTLVAIADALGVPVTALLEEPALSGKAEAPLAGGPDEARRLLEANERFLRAQMDPAMQEEIIRANIDFWHEQQDRIVQAEGFQPEQPEIREFVDSIFEPYRKQRTDLTENQRADLTENQGADQSGSVETGNQR